jgi:hypothetical protein
MPPAIVKHERAKLNANAERDPWVHAQGTHRRYPRICPNFRANIGSSVHAVPMHVFALTRQQPVGPYELTSWKENQPKLDDSAAERIPATIMR